MSKRIRVEMCLLPVMGVFLCHGCGGKMTASDIEGDWRGVMSISGASTQAATLTLRPDGKYDLALIAGKLSGSWTFDGKVLTLKATGMDDGYRKSSNDPQLQATSKPISMHVLAQDKLEWVIDDAKGVKIVFSR